MYTSFAKVDWHAFEYNHSSNLRDAFQKLTEQLFCFEFKQPYGIYRFYNQPYIETTPIHVGNDYIGFQSKYYDAPTKLSEREGELIAAISGANSKYPELTKMIIYTNKEVGMSTVDGKQFPAYIERIVNHGASKGITIDFRGLSEIETMLINPATTYIRDYFFAVDSGIRKTFEHVENHTKTIINSLSSEIKYHNQVIKVSHATLTSDALWSSDKKITILHGKGGCGKSGLVKDLIENITDCPVMAFKATDFNCPSISDFSHKFGDCLWSDILHAFNYTPRKLCVIDSAEKVFSMEYQDALCEGIRTLLSHGWKILITIRSLYLSDFTNHILHSNSFDEFFIPLLSIDKLSELGQKHSFTLPVNPKLQELICNLFYLNLYLSKESVSESQTISDFFDAIWKQIICQSSFQAKSLHTRRGNTICKIAKIVATSGFFYYIPEDNADWDAITALHESEILYFDSTIGGYFIAHDVYEELVLIRIITQEFSRKLNNVSFFSSIGNSFAIRKAFRLWLHNQFEFSYESIESFLSDVLQDNGISSIWKDDILIALMSENSKIFTNHLDNILKKDNYKLLTRAMHLLNTACKEVNGDFCQNILTQDEIKTNIIYRHVRPAGMGWSYLIPYIYTERERITWSSITVSYAIDTVYAWATHNFTGLTTRNAGLLAIFLYSKTVGPNKLFYIDENKVSKVCDAILFSSAEINDELSSILEDIITNNKTSHRELYHTLCDHILKSVSSTGNLCESNPDIVIRLAKRFWVNNNHDMQWHEHGYDLGVHFGLKEHTHHSYYPASAFQTPILTLLTKASKKAVDFVIEFINYTTDAYQKSRLNREYKEADEVEFIIADNVIVRQLISDRLWQMHRGMHDAPTLLESVLMAFERWLYNTFQHLPPEVADAFCLNIISRSRSAAITAVVVGMVIAYPQKLFKTACYLLQTKEIFHYDIARQCSEHLVGLATPQFCDKNFLLERKASNSLSFRKRIFEEILVEYQLVQGELTDEAFIERKNALHSAIDKSFSPEDELPSIFKPVLYRIDCRKMNLVKMEDENGKEQIALVPQLPDDMVQLQIQSQKDGKSDEKFSRLYLWTMAHARKETKEYSQYPEYENNPISALNDSLEPNLPFTALEVYVAAVLLIDFQNQLDPDTFDRCKRIVLSKIEKIITKQEDATSCDGTDGAISSLPFLIGKANTNSINEDPLNLLLILICGWGFPRDCAIKAFAEKLWTRPELAKKIVSLYISIKPHYDEEFSKHCGISPFDFLKKHLPTIKQILDQPLSSLPNFTMLSRSALITLNLMLPEKVCDLTIPVIEQTGMLLWPAIFENQRYRDDDEWPGKHEQSHAYIEHLCRALLQLDITSQNQIVASMVPHLRECDSFKDLLISLIQAEDTMQATVAFWNIWNQLFPCVESICKDEKESILKFGSMTMGSRYRRHSDELILTYLLAFQYWKDGIQGWHTLRQEDSSFYVTAVDKIGYHPVVLYSIARILNSVGYLYESDGIRWIATLLLNNSHLYTCDLPTNTIYYIEEYAQRFCTNNRNNIKRNAEIRNNLSTVLSFLVDRGSTCGYMLREKYC